MVEDMGDSEDNNEVMVTLTSSTVFGIFITSSPLSVADKTPSWKTTSSVQVEVSLKRGDKVSS